MDRFTRIGMLWLGGWLAVVTPACAAAGADTVAADELFLDRVGPLLKQRCLACHGDDPQKLKGELDLRSREAMLRGGESGEPAVAPGVPEESPLYLAVTRDDPDTRRCPRRRTTSSPPRRSRRSGRWIDGGAPWPAPSAGKPAKAYTLGREGRRDGRHQRRAVARMDQPPLQARGPLGLPAAPPAGRPRRSTRRRARTRSTRSSTPGRVASASSRPPRRSPHADPPRHVRPDRPAAHPGGGRGVPRRPRTPTPAFATVVDRLLASPHYGEQWARHWLDVTRYADSSGFANDYERRQRLALSRLRRPRASTRTGPTTASSASRSPATRSTPTTPRRWSPSGFLRMGPWELTGMEVAKVARQKYLDDVTDSVGQVFLGRTRSSAPAATTTSSTPCRRATITGIQAVFATTQLAERRGPFLPQENTSRLRREAIPRRSPRPLRGHPQGDPGQGGGRGPAAGAPSASCRMSLASKGCADGIPESQLPPAKIGLEVRDFGMERIVRKGLERLDWELERYEPFALSVYSGRTPVVKAVIAPRRMPEDRLTAGELEATRILARRRPLLAQRAGRPRACSACWRRWCRRGRPGRAQSRCGDPHDASNGRRAALAGWIASPGNPLTARVMVNRHLALAFRPGASPATPTTSARPGKKPSHPELLDWLACRVRRPRLVGQGHAPADHDLGGLPPVVATPRSRVARGERSREARRYAAFRPAPAGRRGAARRHAGRHRRAQPALGGIPVRPELNPEVAMQPRQVMGTFASAWEPSPRPEQTAPAFALRVEAPRAPRPVLRGLQSAQPRDLVRDAGRLHGLAAGLQPVQQHRLPRPRPGAGRPAVARVEQPAGSDRPGLPPGAGPAAGDGRGRRMPEALGRHDRAAPVAHLREAEAAARGAPRGGRGE